MQHAPQDLDTLVSRDLFLLTTTRAKGMHAQCSECASNAQNTRTQAHVNLSQVAPHMPLQKLPSFDGPTGFKIIMATFIDHVFTALSCGTNYYSRIPYNLLRVVSICLLRVVSICSLCVICPAGTLSFAVALHCN